MTCQSLLAQRRSGVGAPPEVFRASLLKGADSRLNGMVNPLNVTDHLFVRTDITDASDAAVFAELAGNVADGIFAVGLGEQPLIESRAWGRGHRYPAVRQLALPL
jgi:hypothetical protein